MTERENLLIVGSIAFDSVETPKGSVEKALGGSASYASLAASYGANPQVVGVVGDDFGSEYIKRLEDQSVDTRGIEKVEGKTFHWRGRYHENFKDRDTLETALNVFETFNPTLPEEYRATRNVFLANIDPVLQLRVLEQTTNAQVVALDTMNFWIETARDALKEVLKKVDILFINDDEAFQFSGTDTLIASGREILETGPKYVVVKRGEYGSIIFGPDMQLFMPALLLENVADPTGAGDTFAGGFLAHIAGRAHDRQNLVEALMSGTVMASFAVEGFSVDRICGLAPDDISTRKHTLERMTRP